MSRRPTALVVYYFASFALFGAYLPFFPRWVEARGITGIGLGVVAAALPTMSILAPPVFGFVADRLQLRGWLLRLASGGALLAFAALSAAAWLGLDLGFAPVLAAVLVFSFFRAPMMTVADVLAVEQTEAARTSYGGLRRWGSVGFLLGAFATGEFVDPGATRALPTVIAAGLALALAAAFALPARGKLTPRPLGREVAALLRTGRYRAFLLVAFFGQLGHAAYDLCYSLHLRDLGASDGTIGIAWAIGVGAEVVVLSVATPILARTPGLGLLVAAYGLAAFRWVIIAVVPSIAALLCLQLLHAASFALMWIASLAVNRAAVKAEVFATAQAALVASMATGSALGMVLWGTLYRAAGGSAVFAAAAGASLLAALGALVLGRGGAPLGART